jgi:tripartite-type tricarboxylate transporter receptor subunit TctC
MMLVRLVALACAALALPAIALAQAFPTKPVRMVVPFPPGGATDIIGRMVGAKMQEIWGQTVIVENKPGAGTVVATDMVAKAAPDGYTMGFVITAHVINPTLRTNLPYDTLKDLAGVTQVSLQHLVIAANPGFQASTVSDLIALAKKEPGKLTYATPGSGTAMHLGMEMLKTAVGIDIVHVPYKGGAPATQDVMGGRVPILIDVHYSSAANIKAGKLKAIALLSPSRPASAPEIPLVTETVPGVAAISLVGLVVPAATPRDVVRKASADIARAVRDTDLRDKMIAQGMEPVGSMPEEFDAFIRAEIARWAPAVRASGAKVD